MNNIQMIFLVCLTATILIMAASAFNPLENSYPELTFIGRQSSTQNLDLTIDSRTKLSTRLPDKPAYLSVKGRFMGEGGFEVTATDGIKKCLLADKQTSSEMETGFESDPNEFIESIIKDQPKSSNKINTTLSYTLISRPKEPAVYEVTVKGSKTTGLCEEYLCTLWTIHSLYDGKSMETCHGHPLCCNLKGLYPETTGWDTAITVPDPSNPFNQQVIIQAEVAYANINDDECSMDVLNGLQRFMPMMFYTPIYEFNPGQASQCGNLENAHPVLEFNPGTGILEIKSITYAIEKTKPLQDTHEIKAPQEKIYVKTLDGDGNPVGGFDASMNQGLLDLSLSLSDSGSHPYISISGISHLPNVISANTGLNEEFNTQKIYIDEVLVFNEAVITLQVTEEPGSIIFCREPGFNGESCSEWIKTDIEFREKDGYIEFRVNEPGLYSTAPTGHEWSRHTTTSTTTTTTSTTTTSSTSTTASTTTSTTSSSTITATTATSSTTTTTSTSTSLTEPIPSSTTSSTSTTTSPTSSSTTTSTTSTTTTSATSSTILSTSTSTTTSKPTTTTTLPKAPSSTTTTTSTTTTSTSTHQSSTSTTLFEFNKPVEGHEDYTILDIQCVIPEDCPGDTSAGYVCMDGYVAEKIIRHECLLYMDYYGQCISKTKTVIRDWCQEGEKCLKEEGRCLPVIEPVPEEPESKCAGEYPLCHPKYQVEEKCSEDSDCGFTTKSGEYCSPEGHVVEDTITHRCRYPGTENAKCETKRTPRLVDYCGPTAKCIEAKCIYENKPRDQCEYMDCLGENPENVKRPGTPKINYLDYAAD